MIEGLDLIATATFWVAVLRIATPLILGTLGALIGERAGVLNLGIEGIMTAGAFSAWFAVHQGAGLWWGLVVAACVGMAFGALHGWLTVTLGRSQHVAGLGITMIAIGLTSFVYRVQFAQQSSPPTIEAFAPLQGAFAELPVLGPVLGALTAPTLLALAAVPVLIWLLYRTPLGLAVRMVGERPAAADSAGLPVARLRIGAIMAGSALMAVGGAFLTTAAFNTFFVNMVNGRGWICIALVVFGSWRPGKALLGALLFAFFDALQLRLQQGGAMGLPYQVYLMVPYLMSIVALILVSRRATSPQALMQPWRREER